MLIFKCDKCGSAKARVDILGQCVLVICKECSDVTMYDPVFDLLDG